MSEHFYAGTHNVWYGETVHDCACGFSDHEKAEVLAHIENQKTFARMEEDFHDSRAGTR